eukprot:TRINITY_DN5165_c0_g1_i1.p1 TRINITY_DN5165_c0_g1~~TRINITY_DN5165_c0_g1_i1.p1  ORF type:complete len:237 (-),score=36.51 TRINITY_DN5165_c0_g1_i1:126-836(-)
MADLEGKITLIPGTQQASSLVSGYGSTSASIAPQSFAEPTISNEKEPLTSTVARVNDDDSLNETITETIMRDVRMIKFKLQHVLHPKLGDEGAKKLRDWDLWGPLLLCLLLAVTLSLEPSASTSSMFGTIFMTFWFGAFIVTLNAKLLGGKVSFFQSVCVLGYCVFPIDVAALILFVLPEWIPRPIRFIPVAVAFAWASYSSSNFMGALLSSQKRALALFPVVLFYLFLSWLVLIV